MNLLLWLSFFLSLGKKWRRCELEVQLSSLRLVNEKHDKVQLVKSDIFQLAPWVSRQHAPSEILAHRTEILRYGLFFHA